MASNDDHVVPASGDERRFLVLDVGAEKQQQSAYFKAIMAQMDAGGREALLHLLLTYDLSEFDHRDVPQTDALREQKELSLDPMADWWLNKLKEGTLFADEKEWPREVRKEALIEDFVEHNERWRVAKRGSQTALGKFMHKYNPHMQVIQKNASFWEMGGDGFQREVRKRAYFWTLPPLQEARTRWDDLHGKQDWATYKQYEMKDAEADKSPF